MTTCDSIHSLWLLPFLGLRQQSQITQSATYHFSMSESLLFFSSGQFGTSWSCSCGHAFLSMISSLQPQEFSVSGCRILLPQDLRHVSQQFPSFKQSTETTVTRFGGNILSLYVYVLYFILLIYDILYIL